MSVTREKKGSKWLSLLPLLVLIRWATNLVLPSLEKCLYTGCISLYCRKRQVGFFVLEFPMKPTGESVKPGDFYGLASKSFVMKPL